MSRGGQAREDILDAAEQMIAEHGVRVPLRDIAVAAGQRNNSAVNYHFRNRQELIVAVVRRRLEPMEEQRRQMLDALTGGHPDVENSLRIMVLPLLAVDSEHYARFLQAAALHLPTDLDQMQGSVWPQIIDDLSRAVPTADRRARRRRVSAVASAMFALLADRERHARVDPAAAATPDEIVVMLGAMLTAPIPRAACREDLGAPLSEAGSA